MSKTDIKEKPHAHAIYESLSENLAKNEVVVKVELFVEELKNFQDTKDIIAYQVLVDELKQKAKESADITDALNKIQTKAGQDLKEENRKKFSFRALKNWLSNLNEYIEKSIQYFRGRNYKTQTSKVCNKIKALSNLKNINYAEVIGSRQREQRRNSGVRPYT
ncbi:MAG: hypothetical protein SFT68_00290 [Rickettsiaceae bacterium]|nr:hypothetical protein [Rickettsiaceae bacterium]